MNPDPGAARRPPAGTGANKEVLVRALAASYDSDHDGWARWLRRLSNEELRRLAARRGVVIMGGK